MLRINMRYIPFITSAIQNIVVVALFVQLSIHFNAWWISLFSLLVICTPEVVKIPENKNGNKDS